MKFRYKVMLANLILLSVSLGIVGYLMIRRNFVLAKNTQVHNAVIQNNLVQSSVEYELLRVLSDEDCDVGKELGEIGGQVAGGLSADSGNFYIRYENQYVYSFDDRENRIPYQLFDGLNMGSKRYFIDEESGVQGIYVTSCSSVRDKNLYIVSKSDISEIYRLMESQTRYFRAIIVAVLFVASAVMYVISRLMTKPLEKLARGSDRIADEQYDTRIFVRSKDEVGLLAERFNLMAAAVESHVEELRDMVRRRDQFVADFTHEIKTPMTSIIGYADTMRSVELPRQDEILALNYIFSEGRRLEHMSGKLFQLIYLKQNDIERSAVHAGDLAAEVEKIAVPLLRESELVLEIDTEPAVLNVDRDLMVTVFINLLDNARKASQRGAVISFEGRFRCPGREDTTDAGERAQEVIPDGMKYVFSVRDHGEGMSEETVQRMCDEFYMADKSRARSEGGAGIGMSLVALILEKHGAELEVDSALGEGTEIRVVLTGGVDR